MLHHEQFIGMIAHQFYYAQLDVVRVARKQAENLR